jgi:hypothetical protein
VFGIYIYIRNNKQQATNSKQQTANMSEQKQCQLLENSNDDPSTAASTPVTTVHTTTPKGGGGQQQLSLSGRYNKAIRLIESSSAFAMQELTEIRRQITSSSLFSSNESIFEISTSSI